MKSSSIRTAIVLGVAFLAGQPCASAQETTRVSVDSSGAEALGYSVCDSISSDGRFVAFWSDASNLVAGDTNGVEDLFVRDRVTGITERVSVDSSGVQGNGWSGQGSLSADGRFIAFSSESSNLVAGDVNGVQDVFLRDRLTGTTELVSVDSAGVQGNGVSYVTALSADGRLVAFESQATNLVAGDTNSVGDVFVHDRVTGITERVSVDSSGNQATDWSAGPWISADGRFIGFSSNAPNLVANDTNGFEDAFVRDLVLGTTERVSVNSSGTQGNSQSTLSGISSDGRFVLLTSTAKNFSAYDYNQASDVFVHDRVTGSTERVDVDSYGRECDLGAQAAGGMTADGRIVAFFSASASLVSDDTNEDYDAFIHDRVTGITERVSVDSQGGEQHGRNGSTQALISADGRIVAFTSDADDLVAGDTNSTPDVFVHEIGPTHAFWSNYGPGFQGTHGVPSFAPRSDPVIGTTVTLDLGNSWGEYTVGALFIGFEPTVIHSSWGGDLFVVPLITQLVGLSPWGASLLGDIPDDESLCGCLVELQVIEVDPGAAKGVSFTQGLKLVLGR
jgi:Tol biopolymer transport system component